MGSVPRNLPWRKNAESSSSTAQGNKRRTSIRVRLTLPFLLITIAVAGMGILVVTRLVAGSIEERLANQLADSGQSATQSVVEIEQLHLASLRLMVNTVGMDQALMTQDGTLLEEILLPLTVSQGMDRTIALDAAGRTLYQLDATDAPLTMSENASAWPSVQAVLSGQRDAIGDKYTEIVPHTDGAVLYTTAPVVTNDGEILGAVLVGTKLENAVRFINNQAIAQITLFDMDGAPMASTLPIEAIPQLSDIQVAEYLEESQITNPIGDLAIEMVTYQTLITPLWVRNEIVGLKMIALPNNFIVDRLSVSRNTFAGLFVVFFFVVLGIGMWTSRSILIPLDRLVATTRQIRSGRLDERVRLGSSDELGELSSSFDDMADKLVSRNKRISRLYRQQLTETAQRDAILESIGDAVLVLNSDGTEYLRNEAVDLLFTRAGASPKDLDRLNHILQSPQRLTEPQVIALGGSYYSGLARRVMAKNEMAGYVLVFRDITDIIEAENTKDEIMQQISHELRTPLSAIFGYVELLGMFNQFDEQSTEYLQNANHHLGELQYMINQVVGVTAILSQRFELSLTTLDVVKLIDKLLMEQKPKFDEKALSLQVEAPPSLMIQADERRLSQALEHILNNARQYTLADGQVSVEIKPRADHIIIKVQDNGVGIKPEEIDRVFERMYRGSAADAGKTDARGLGVGLFISREIIRLHKGDIRIASQPDQGTTVQIKLPRVVNEQRVTHV